MNKKIILILAGILFITACMQELLFKNPEDPANSVTAPSVYKPKNLKATDDRENVVTVSWDKTNNAAKYLVYSSDNSTDGFREIAEVSTNKYDDMSVSQNVIYYYKVKAELTTGIITDFSNTDAGFRTGSGVVSGLNPPTEVLASDGTFTDKIRISWKGVTGAEKYYIFRCDTAEGTYEELGSVSTLFYEDSGFSVNKKYYYKLKSWSTAKGYSDYSGYNDGYILSIPKNIVATDGDYLDKVAINWDLTNDASKFYIYRSDAEDGTYLNIANVTVKAYNDTSATAGTKYYYKIRSFNTDVTSDYSAFETGYKKLGTPVNLSATTGGYIDKVRITWDSVVGATSYTVSRRSTIGGTYSDIGTTDTYIYDDTTVGLSQTFFYKVRGYNSSSSSYSDNSAASNGGYISGNDQITPFGSFIDGSISASQTKWYYINGIAGEQYQIYWASKIEGGKTANIVVSGYRADMTTSYFVDISLGFNTPQTITALATERIYIKVVEAENNGGSFSLKVKPILKTVTGIGATDGTDSAKIIINWSAINHAETYYIYRATSSGGSYSEVGNTTGTTYNDTTAPNYGTRYFYKIKGFMSPGDDDIWSSSSSEETGYKDLPDLTTDMNLQATDGTSTDWTTVSWNIINGASYELYKATSETGDYGTAIYAGANLTFNDAGTPGIKYYYKVKVDTEMIDRFGNITTGYRKLSTPTDVSATDGSYTDKVTITWNEVAGANSYDIWRATGDSAGTYTKIGSLNDTLSATETTDDTTIGFDRYFYKIMAYASSSASYSDLSASDAGYIPFKDIQLLNGTTNIANNGTLDFGTVNATFSYELTLTIKNTGTQTLTLTGSPYVAPLGDVSVDTQPSSASIAANGTKTFKMSYRPAANGTRTGSLTIQSDDPDEGTFVINITGNAITFEPKALIDVPAGTFMFQDSASVTLSAFKMGKYEVTYGLWREVYLWATDAARGADIYTFANAGSPGYNGTGGDNEPVTVVNWRDCIVWCNAYSEKEGLSPVYWTDEGHTALLRVSTNTGSVNTDPGSEDYPYVNWSANGYRLPTEAEWEYAARYQDGTNWTPTNYLSGATADYNNATASQEVAWYSDNSGSKTHQVGTKRANQLGICDMSGNLWEWNWDWYDGAVSSGTNPTGPETGSSRLLRGGSFINNAINCQSGYRSNDLPWACNNDCGFRLSRSSN